MQSNHFSQPEISFKCSIAKIPFRIFSFNGFIAGLWLKNKLIEFTTYNFSKVKRCKINEREVEIIIESPKYILKILVYRSKTAKLAAPIQGFMDAKIDESMTSQIQVKLIEKKTKKTLLDDIGKSAGCEVAGNYSIYSKRLVILNLNSLCLITSFYFFRFQILISKIICNIKFYLRWSEINITK